MRKIVERDGLKVRKEMKIFGETVGSFSDTHYSIIGLELNKSDETIEIQCLMGAAPVVEALFYTLLADTDVRQMISLYQTKGRKYPFKVWEKRGLSGARDIFLTYGEKKGNFAVTRTKKLLHISCFGKMNEGFNNYSDSDVIYIGDFVELASFLGYAKDMKVESLLEKAGGVEYLPVRKGEEMDDFKNEVTKIL